MFLEQNDEKNIVSAILEAITANVNEFYGEEKLTHRNGFHFLKWDYIFTNIENNIRDSVNLEIIKANRGYFSFDLIVDRNKKIIYSVLKTKNLKSIKNERNYSHYLWQLASINGIQEDAIGQTSFFELAPEINNKDILNLLDFEPEKYVTILIDETNKLMPKISEVVLDSRLESIYERTIKEVTSIGFAECIGSVAYEDGGGLKENKVSLKFTSKTNERLNKRGKEKIKSKEEKKEKKE